MDQLLVSNHGSEWEYVPEDIGELSEASSIEVISGGIDVKDSDCENDFFPSGNDVDINNGKAQPSGSETHQIGENTIEITAGSSKITGVVEVIAHANADLEVGRIVENAVAEELRPANRKKQTPSYKIKSVKKETKKNSIEKFQAIQQQSKPLSRQDFPTHSVHQKTQNSKSISKNGNYRISDKKQFVNGKWFNNILVELYSCRLQKGGNTFYMRKQKNTYLLTTDEQYFVARVSVGSLNGTDWASIDDVNRGIFSKIDLIKIIEDEIVHDCIQSCVKLVKILKIVAADHGPIRSSPSALLLLALSSLKDQDTFTIFKSLNKIISLPDNVRTAAGECLKNETKCRRRIDAPFFIRQSSHDGLKDVVREIYEEGVLGHRNSLIEQCPPALPMLIRNIQDLPPDLVLHISKSDVDVFHHLVTITDDPDILPFFEHIVEVFIAEVARKKGKYTIENEIPLVNPMLGFLFKSFWEKMNEIKGIVDDCTYKQLLTLSSRGWRLADIIPWPKLVNWDGVDNTTQHLYRSTDCQYRFVFKLMKHFFPNGSGKKNSFEYQIQLKTENKKWWTKLMDKFVGKKIDLDHDRSIWLYIVDHTIARVVIDYILSFDDFLELYGPLIDSHWSFVTESPTTENHESLRVVTHSTLKYIVLTSPFLLQTDAKSANAQMILRRQINCLARVSVDMSCDDLTHICFNNLIDEYIKYWALHSRIVQEYEGTPEYLADQVTNLFHYILDLICKILDKSVPVKNLSVFLRSINEFLSDYQNMAFTSRWYVKSENGSSSGLTKVDNKIADEIDCSYLVTDIHEYLESTTSYPPHYNIRIVRQLIEYVNLVLEKNWVTDKEPVVAQFDAACILLNAIRRSFVYLKEQPDYRDFTKYEMESTEPFICAINNSVNFDDFQKRVGIVGESFWYVRKMDEIGVERALEIMEPIFDDAIQKDVLRICYERYSVKFLLNIHNSAEKKSIDEKISSIVDRLETHRKDICVKNWSLIFKKEVIPEILADLSAVWSLMMSEDVASGSKLIQPHCIQILCVLRLLGVDQSSPGVKNHLAEILTGQGKSVVLALVSLVFALFGHDVYIACYSKYLVSRDSENFEEFFRKLRLGNKVRYINLKSLAQEYFHPVINGRKVWLRDKLEGHVRWGTRLPSLATASSNFKNTILLIDEVDVFFSENVYGSVLRSACAVHIYGLPEIQEYMWKLATTGVHTVDTLLECTEEFIDSKVQSKDHRFKVFNKVRNIRKSIEILDDKNDKLFSRKYSSNRELLEDHLHRMAEQAIKVSTIKSIDGWINDAGFFGKRDPMDNAFESNYVGYHLIFSYFKLKREYFDDKFGSNYGYLHLKLGSISYAKLPADFLLVLGVSGTLRNVYDHEKKAMREAYNIVNYTGVPSFYGTSNVKFHQNSDFNVLESEDEWHRISFTRAYAEITSRRSVIMFFKSQSKINSFVEKYGSKFASLNILTEDTADLFKEVYIGQAGIPSTLTLATRGMGRGVDFKSSLAVEKNGGIHVIQTFFSIDLKEETQIRGRTARKDNKGSYELILCKTHLVKDKLLSDQYAGSINYSQLDESRTELMELEGKENAENAEKYLIEHETTMKYWS